MESSFLIKRNYDLVVVIVVDMSRIDIANLLLPTFNPVNPSSSSTRWSYGSSSYGHMVVVHMVVVISAR